MATHGAWATLSVGLLAVEAQEWAHLLCISEELL